MFFDKITVIKNTLHATACIGKTAIIAIDGRCASGKSTLADELKQPLDAAVIHMDDFFLRKEQRTPERFKNPGGNIDHERFLTEVLIPLKENGCCTYRPYRCSTDDFGVPITVSGKNVVIVEGSYSCHPKLFAYYDIRIFLTVDKTKQLKRLLLREGEEKTNIFREKWIPLEEKYLSEFKIADNCNLVF